MLVTKKVQLIKVTSEAENFTNPEEEIRDNSAYYGAANKIGYNARRLYLEVCIILACVARKH